jgi:hypothetical protein
VSDAVWAVFWFGVFNGAVIGLMVGTMFGSWLIIHRDAQPAEPPEAGT